MLYDILEKELTWYISLSLPQMCDKYKKGINNVYYSKA